MRGAGEDQTQHGNLAQALLHAPQAPLIKDDLSKHKRTCFTSSGHPIRLGHRLWRSCSAAGHAYQTASDTRGNGMAPLSVPHEVPPVRGEAHGEASSSYTIRIAGRQTELPRGGQGRGEDFTPSGRPPMGGCIRPRTTRLDLDASTHDQIVAGRSTRRA